MSDKNWLIAELPNDENPSTPDYQESYNAIIETFKGFKEKILEEKNKKFELTDYTNIFDKNKPTETEYLCHFLEITSSVFGSSRPGNANQFGIKRNATDKSGDESYYISRELAKSIKAKNDTESKDATKQVADDTFGKIKELLKNLCEKLEDDNGLSNNIKNAFNDSPIQAKQCLLKFVYLNNMDKLINIYRKETLQSIAQALDLDNIESASILELNYAISNKIITGLGLKDNIKVKLFNIGERLWQMFGATFPITAKNTILYGAPGTGKTYSTINSTTNQIKATNGNIDEQFCLVQFHPSYSYEDFIDGIKPTKVGNGAVNLELVNGKFKEMCIRAFKELVKAENDNPKAKKYYFVADEINRAELSRVFGELLLCLEEDKRLRFEGGKLVGTKVQTQNSALWESKHAVVIVNKDGKSITNENYNNLADNEKLEYTMYFGVPENLYFIGTMNDIDRSIDSFDMALRRRFFWKKCECDYDAITNHYQTQISSQDIDNFINQCKNLNNHISGASNNGLNLGSSYELGHSYFMSSDKKLTAASKNEMWENHIQPLIREYLRALYTETEIKTKLQEAEKIFMPKQESNT